MTTNRTPEDQALIDALVGALKKAIDDIHSCEPEFYGEDVLDIAEALESALREAGEEEK